MARTETIAVAGAGVATFDKAALGFSPVTHHHTVTVEAGVTTFDVDIRIGGRWVRPSGCTDVAEADAVVLRQVGYDAVRVTATDAGDITLTSWKDPS